MNNQPPSPNNVLNNFILPSSDTNSLIANNGSEEIVNNNVVPQALTKSVGMGNGWFMQNNQQQYPRINLEELMQDDVWSNPQNDQVTTSPFRGIGDEEDHREETRKMLKSLHDGVKMLQALASNMTCIVHQDRGDDTCEDNLVDHKN
ncbi:hypothetical protein CTI12_AA506610 [Artemisia annua]|uniref:Uncharacterized protein n=1 Tax=Artemisia annua TaxID=35608 RepID=A0A2U1LCG0_ARTAN|nr:hypothetical protein CTI12_AA506610 [Artemisia annua]